MAKPLKEKLTPYDLSILVDAYLDGLNNNHWGIFNRLKWLLGFKYLINPFSIEEKLLKTEELTEKLFPTEYKKEDK